jgi:predicted DNA-binding protein YlxM (UPF0122 family)
MPSHLTMMRRGAIVSRDVYYQSKSYIESEKNVKKKVLRRYAITKYSKEVPKSYLKSLKKQYHEEKRRSVQTEMYETNDRNRTIFVGKPKMTDDRLIVIDVNNDLSFKYTGSKLFITLVNIYYNDNYRFADTETNRSVIRSSIQDDLKRQGFRFVKIFNVETSMGIVLEDCEVQDAIFHWIESEAKKETQCNYYL